MVQWHWARAAALHDDWPAPAGRHRRTVAVCTLVDRPALVLGSTQADAVADAARVAAASVDLVRRRSGGGAVLVVPDGQVWIDVWVPRQDARWEDDVVRSSQWLGDVWAAALDALGVGQVAVHRGRALDSAWSKTLCFAGLGPGEVTAGGRKVVGLAQRRTRHGARMHTMAHLHWDPEPLCRLLSLEEPDRARAVRDTAEVAVGLAQLVGGSEEDGLGPAVEEAVLTQLTEGPARPR